jgi:hypothetical protein
LFPLLESGVNWMFPEGSPFFCQVTFPDTGKHGGGGGVQPATPTIPVARTTNIPMRTCTNALGMSLSLGTDG